MRTGFGGKVRNEVKTRMRWFSVIASSQKSGGSPIWKSGSPVMNYPRSSASVKVSDF